MITGEFRLTVVNCTAICSAVNRIGGGHSISVARHAVVRLAVGRGIDLTHHATDRGDLTESYSYNVWWPNSSVSLVILPETS